jgi:hypothetical protein
MDVTKLKRVENLAPGDAVKAWGPDLDVDSARPMTDGTVEVAYNDGALTVVYGAGTVIETA